MPLFLVEGTVTRRVALQVEAADMADAQEGFIEVVSAHGSCDGLKILDTDEPVVTFTERYELDDLMFYAGPYPFSSP